MSNGVVFVGRKKEIEDFRSAVNSLMEGGQVRLVVGAAGYGKSELLKEFERRCKEDEMIIENGEVIVIRDEFSRSDDPLSFLSRIKDAWLREVNPKSMGIIGWIKKHRTYLEGTIDAVAKGASLVLPAGGLISSMKIGLPSVPDLPQNAGFLLQAFIADLAEFHKYNPNKRLVLLLDEYHKISNEDIFNAMFNDIIDNIQKLTNVMIVIASRKQMRNSDAMPLALFKEHETESFLMENLGIDDRKLIGDAQTLLRGHPYSLGLLLLISKEEKTNIADIIENLPETKVDDYLHTQFFDHLEKEIQRFLRKVCVLQILDEHACTFVIQSEEYDATVCSNMLLQLQRLMVLDELGKVNRIKLFRLHDLFRDFLMAMNEASLPELHNMAAEYYLDIIEKQEDIGTDISVVRFALYHLQESRNFDAFVMLLNEYETGLRTLGYVKELLGYYTTIDFEKISEPRIKSDTLLNYGIALYLTGEYQQALEKYQKSMEIKEKLGDQRGIAGTLHQIAMIHQDKGEYQQALEKYQKSMEIKEKLGDQSRIAITLHQIANVHYVKGEYQQALEKYEQSMEIEKKLGNQRGIAQTLHQIAMIHQGKGEYQQALEKYQQSMEIKEKLGDQRGIAQTLHQIAMIHQDKGEYQQALEKYQQSMEIKEKLGDQSGIARTFHQIANVHYVKGEYQQALEKYQKSMEIYEKLGDQSGIAATLHQIANLHYAKGEYQQALEKYEQSMEIEKKLGDQRGIAQTLHQIAMIHQDKGEYQQALEKYQQSMEIKEKLGDQSGIAITLHQIANVHYVKGEYDQALEKYEKSMEIEEKLGDQSGIAYTAAQMSLLYSKIGKKENAIEYTQKALEIFENIGLDNEAMRARAQLDEIRES